MPDEAIHTVALRCQIQIEVTRRRYTPGEQEQMLDLFGRPDRWSQTLRSLLWTHVNWVVPAFAGAETVVDMQVPCSFDFNVAATKYFAGLADGEIPLAVSLQRKCLLRSAGKPSASCADFVGTGGSLQASRKVWREMMDIYYPNSVWINLHKDVFERLYRYKMQHGLLNWEQALERILAEEVEVNS